MTAVTPVPRNPQMVSRAKTLEEKKEKRKSNASREELIAMSMGRGCRYSYEPETRGIS